MKENELKLQSGWPVLVAVLLTPLLSVLLVAEAVAHETPWPGVAAAFITVAWVISLFGFIVVNPNQARVIQLFGAYVGTAKETGFFYANPFYSSWKVSLRVQTFETGVSETAEKKDAAGNVTRAGSKHRQPSKVNDRDGTPIEIAAVVVYRIVNAAESVFQVDDCLSYVHIQSDAALRNLASQYSYDNPDDETHSLRGHVVEVAERLKYEIQERVKQAGVEVLEARLSTLAYATEIAAVMLQRQQATALIAARQKIVEGAVGMVHHALEMLAERNMVPLDDDRKAAMVSNLLVVLCSHSAASPVINAGTIYQ